MEHVHQIPLWAMIPFGLMLGAIAVLPLVAHHWWESNKNKLLVALGLGIPTASWLIFNGMTHDLIHQVVFDYIPFIALLGGLFVITGGIFVDGNIESKPKVNATILGIGAVLASFMGTTGAAMLLIRPLISTNKERKYKVHTILFFIAIVANCGGLLTPLGDPPLFLMYLRGAEFIWFMSLLPQWLFVNGFLLLLYFAVDNYYWKKEDPEAVKLDHDQQRPIKIRGSLNFLWLAGVVLSVAFINGNTIEAIHHNHYLAFIREGVIVLMMILSLVLTKKETREANQFTWEPIEEVAFLFIGIFVTMVPALKYLQAHAADLGINSAHMFYYATGGLSGFLDNAPTAVTFHSLALGLVEQNPAIAEGATMIAGIPEIFLNAICVSAVFFGAMTYIGNGPNFMVKAIAESQNIKMPDFFSYIFKFSLIVLLPILIITQLIFY